jgi:glucose-1-phosphate adenylyltransferase
MDETAVMVLAGGKAERMSVLTRVRTKSSVPFGAAYRIIDFTLSNCIHSQLRFIYILAQYFPESLHDHIGTGAPWDLDRHEGGVWVVHPYARKAEHHWFRGTADALWQNFDLIDNERFSHILVLSGDHVYKMDYRPMIREHISNGADLTIAVTHCAMEDAKRFGILELNEDKRIVSFEEKPQHPKSNLANMGIYLFNRKSLSDRLQKVCGEDNCFDLVFDVIMGLIAEQKVYGHVFEGFWRDAGTLGAYYDANMDLVSEMPRLDLYDRNWPILTKIYDNPPARILNPGRIHNSLAGSGCIIEGEVEQSVLSSNVRVEKGARINQCIILKGTTIKAGAVVSGAIIDKDVVVGDGAVIGFGGQAEQPAYAGMGEGLVVVGKGTQIPAGCIVGRQVILDPFLTAEHFTERQIKAGTHLKWSKTEDSES